MDQTLTLSLTELTEQLRARKVSPVELMGSVLDRIDETNGDLNAFVAMRPQEFPTPSWNQPSDAVPPPSSATRTGLKSTASALAKM